MRIKELRDINGIQQKTLANILGISSNTLSQYENGKRTPNIDIVSKLANYFNVSTDYIYGLSSFTTCNDCGLSYCPDNELDLETHKVIHALWLNAKKKYGFCYSNYGGREQIKAKNRNIVKDFSLPLSVRYDAQIEVFKCLFSRSLESSNYDNKHVDFEEYISMLLNQKSVQETLGKDLTNKMISEFGTKEGIPNGQTYYYTYENTNNEFTNISFNNAEQSMIVQYRTLDPHGKDMVDMVLNKEAERIKELENSQATVTDIQSHLEVNAAHARTDIEPTPEGQAHDDAIMNDDSEWE